MISQLYIPAAPLGEFIESFYYFKGYTPEHAVDRFLPDGNIQLIIELTEHPKYIYDNYTLKEIQACKKVWFSGFRTEPITIPSGQDSEMIIVQFMKGRAYPFLSDPLCALTNHVVDAELVLKNAILDLRERIQEVSTVRQKLLILEEYFTHHYRSYLQHNPFTNYVVEKILQQPEQCKLIEISDKVGFSQKHLIKIFKEHVGVTPKEFLKIVRFQKVILEIEQQKQVYWTRIAHDCGFYDQSHFIADFKLFSGFTPVDYLRQRGEFLNYIPIHQW